MNDPFFEIIYDSHWNACVGLQGNEFNYIVGYLDAAKLLADMLVDQDMTGKRDTLIMPILYNVRHGFELALKYALTELQAMALVGRPDGKANHHILRYWRHISDANIPDRMVREIVAALEPFATSLSRMDVDGQQLRYFITLDNRTSFEEQSVVHLPLVRKSVTRLATLLNDLIDRLSRMRQLQSTGTRTTRCSRLDLAEIVEIVGPHRTWTEEDFLERKSEAMNRFGLTKKAFSNAIDAIRNSRELAASVGIETGLRHLKDSQAYWLAERWLEAFPISTQDIDSNPIYSSEIEWEQIERYGFVKRQLIDLIIANLSQEVWADIETIYYIGRNGECGEYYDGDLADTIRKYEGDRSRRWEYIHHVVSKANLLDFLISGLRRVGRPSLADKLTELQTPGDRAHAYPLV